jgi:hypothetical protein
MPWNGRISKHIYWWCWQLKFQDREHHTFLSTTPVVGNL